MTTKTVAKKKTTKPAPLAELQTVGLAIKHRPINLDQLVGNAALKKMISGFFKTRRLPSTFLLTGAHGQGKTTTGRIFARMIQCDTNDVCGTCFSCKTFNSSMNFEEVNVGAEGGVENARALIAKAKLSPAMGKKRIIMLDEVQKLTGSAASALLKELEEPSPNTIWLLATNMPEKLMPTIRSRCTHLKLETAAPKEIAQFLWRIAKAEIGKSVDDKYKPLFMTMAKMGGGHVRDSVQMLETFLAMSENGTQDVDIAEVLSTFSASDEQAMESTVLEVMYSLATGRTQSMLKHLAGLDGKARDFIYKSRYFIDLKIAKWAGTAKYYTPNHKIFDDKVKSVDGPNLILMLNQLQDALIRLEQTFNTVPGLDERIGLQTELMIHSTRWASKVKA